MANRIELGKAISKARKERKLRQVDLSTMTGVNVVVISKIENGKFRGSFDIFEKCAEAVGLQFELVPKVRKIPNLNELKDLFGDDD